MHRITLCKEDPDIILAADTSMKDDQKIGIACYIPYQRNTEARDDGKYLPSGAAILIKKHIQHLRVDHSFVHNTVAIEVSTTTGPIIIATIYHPPRRNFLPMEDLN